jgi:hypothetical protein
MNSKQRRQQRVFEHEVTIMAGQGQWMEERWFEFDRRLEQARGWLQWQTKRKNYIVCPKQYNSQTFKFRSGAMASVFALKWS